MPSGPFGIPPGLPPTLERFFRGLASFWDNQQRVSILGVRPSGDDAVVRVLASRATLFVRAHVQHDGPGGGGESFDSGVYVSDTRIDCRVNRQQDFTITRDTGYDYFVWLIPEFLGDDTEYIRFDGASGNGADKMAFVAVGSSSLLVRSMERELQALNEKFERLLTQAQVITDLALKPGEKL